LPASLCRFTQALPQAVWPDEQVRLHTPPLQLWPLPHAFPHPPQFCGSLCRFTQIPEQAVSPTAQVGPPLHCPFVQLCPAAQQTVPQPTWSVGQQSPPLHAVPAGQAVFIHWLRSRS
jgi:hypothetical protein